MVRRKTPKELLEFVQKEEQSQTKGQLKIFLGAAPGVGKTYTMLEAARNRKDEGVDVVGGIVETHGRKETEAFLKDLEILPRKKINYRGKDIEEFDLDSALARNPELILVDEMAHHNAPGSRHNKRWQDILELLDRGIDVYTTLNVQHIESLNNIITQITGIVVRETVPDTVLAKAIAVELIDLPPTDLIKRLEEGKVYVPLDIKPAIENYFKKSNLMALRELALRFTAEQVDMEVLLHRRGESIEKIWPTKERLLVCVGPGIDSSKLIRATCRMARSLHAEWIALSIETPQLRDSPSKRKEVVQHLRLAEQLGGENLMIGGLNIADEIINFAKERNVTKIILAKKLKSRWQEFFHLSLADELVRRSSDIDLYILRGSLELTSKETKRETKTPVSAYITSVITVAFCSIAGFLLYPYLELSVVIMIYFLGIIFVSVRGYDKPAFLASILSVLAIGFFFVSPHMVTASDTQYLITLLTMLIISQIIAHLTVENKQQKEFSRWREYRTSSMHLLSKDLAKTRGTNQLLRIAIKHISEVFNCTVLAFLPNESRQLVPVLEGDCSQLILSAKDQSVAQWVFELGQMAGFGTQTLPDNEAIYLPLLGRRGAVGVLRIVPIDPEQLLIPDQIHLLEGFANQTAMALEVDRLQLEAKRNEMKIESDRVNNILMKYISENMRAPLLDIMGLANNIIEVSKQADSLDTNNLQAYSSEIYSNSAELNHQVNKLSQIAHLEESEILKTKAVHSLSKVIDSALNSLSKVLKTRKVTIHLPADLPKIHFNMIYIEQVFFNIIENAVKYTPENTGIDILAEEEPTQILISICDEGPGVALEEINKIFEKFYRGHSISHIKGMGLGLAICQRVITLHNGEIWAENGKDGGAIFRFTLPK